MSEQVSCKRRHPYLGEWVILAPATDGRPWNGATIKKDAHRDPEAAFDPSCYLCPGVRRSAGKMNPEYEDVFIFDNDFASLNPQSAEAPEPAAKNNGDPARGVCRVVCYSPDHQRTLAEMEIDGVEKVLRALCAQFEELTSRPGIEYVMIFENKGREIGVSNPHPHGQIYATDFIPRIPETMYRHAAEFSARHGGCVFCDVLDRELSEGDGVISRNEHFAAFVPAFARFKYEVHIVPFRHVPFLTSLSAAELRALAEIYRQVLIQYDNLFAMRIPNITVFYNGPCRPGIDPAPWHFHIQFAPPIRSADKLKYLAGFETGGGNIINPSLPADSARELRQAMKQHFAGAASA